jgi:putative DNA primase/helicase
VIAFGTDYQSPPGWDDTHPAALDGEQHRGQVRMAYRLAHRYEHRLLHVADLGWHSWDDNRWALDKDGAATRAVLDTLRAGLVEAVDLDKRDRDDLQKDIRRCESDTGVRGVLALASALPPLSAVVGDLDADPYLINTRAGTLDLRLATTRKHDPADRITKVTGTGYSIADYPPLAESNWLRFLESVLPDAEVRGFLQRLIGLSLAGKVLEHVLPIFTGSGRNGKGTLVRVVSAALGDYAIEAEPELFIARDRAHPTGQLDLRGVRFATCQETDDGKRLAVATVKRLTGGDIIRARAMRQDFIEFAPSHLPVLITNHLPRVPADDPALWARLRVVPFTESFIGREDTGLEERLLLELPTVLGWAVAGWKQYQEQRLNAPEAVRLATDSYRLSSDALAKFIEDKCTTSQHVHVGARELFTAWRAWCAESGETPGTDREFGPAIEARGYTRRRAGTGIRFGGLALLSNEGV